MRNYVLMFLGLLLFVSCSSSATKSLTPKLAFDKPLPQKYNSPDGMTLDDEGNIYLSINGCGEGWKYPAQIVRITPSDMIEEVALLPLHPTTGAVAPLGVVYASDGSLYVSDNQSFVTADTTNISRVLRVSLDGSSKVVAEGINQANGIDEKDGFLYVADTQISYDGQNYISGVYRFSLSELAGEQPIKVTGIGDSHLLLTFETASREHLVGANGVCLDSKGNLYVCNFGDQQIRKYAFDNDGNISSEGVLCEGNGMMSADGMHCDSEDNLWVADFVGNAIFKISTQDGKMELISKNGIGGDGSDGLLDSPSECIRRGDRIYVSNIDIDYQQHKHDNVPTMSILVLK